MCHDRIDGDDLPVIHAFLAKMLSVRRAGVTTAVQMLQARGLIQALRGSIKVLDRAGLET
ncbi:Crp-like helix-turn-helix domain-containing protein, partial [Palleronia marisminoris]|uniref:helix-turn-helix domain-containing protein n=1 Tax=Palleronia marisminoris TaxID=315423 RepID=UPI0008E866D7